MPMSRIHIEERTRHNDIFWIRCFHDEHAARHKYPHRLGDQFTHVIETDVFNDVERRDYAYTFTWQRAQHIERIALLHVHAPLVARRKHALVEIDPLSVKPLRRREVEPFTTAATEIERNRVDALRDQGANEWQVNLQSSRNKFPRAPMAILKCLIKTIHYDMLLTVVGSQATPTKVCVFMLITSKTSARSRHW